MWLFCVAIQPLIEGLKTILNNDGISMFYADDGTISAPFATVVKCIEYITNNGPKYGFILNKKKGKYLLGKCTTSDIAYQRRRVLLNLGLDESIIVIHPHNKNQNPEIYGLKLLGCYIGTDSYTRTNLSNDIYKKLKTQSLILIEFQDPQIKNLMFRLCFCTKINYLLRCTPPTLVFNFINNVNYLLKQILSSLFKRTISLQLWEQLLLPIKSGGLGLPDYMKSHQCAYSASIYECSQTISNYFPNFLDMDTNKTANYFYNSISNISLLRNNIANSLPPISLIEISKIYSEGGTRSLQSKLCQLYAENNYDIIKKKKTDPNDLAFFISISDNSGFCGKWLEIAPKNNVLKIPPNNFVTQLCYRFRLEIPNFVPNIKCTCTRQPYLDKYGYHLATACPRSKHRFITHDEMVLLFKEFLNYSGLKTIHEEVGCFHACDLEDDRRPDLSVISFPGVIGKMIVDFSLTCPTPVNSTVVLSLNQALTPDRANDRTYQSKITKYQKVAEQNGLVFLPLIMESTGRPHKETISFFRKIVQFFADKDNYIINRVSHFWMGIISCRLQNLIASAILNRQLVLMQDKFANPGLDHILELN